MRYWLSVFVALPWTARWVMSHVTVGIADCANISSPLMPYIPDDISQMPDNHPSYIPAPEDRRERLTILLHKRLDQVIDQEQQPGLSRQERKRLAGLHQQIRTDMAAIRYGATEKTVGDLERRYGGVVPSGCSDQTV